MSLELLRVLIRCIYTYGLLSGRSTRVARMPLVVGGVKKRRTPYEPNTMMVTCAVAVCRGTESSVTVNTYVVVAVGQTSTAAISLVHPPGADQSYS